MEVEPEGGDLDSLDSASPEVTEADKQSTPPSIADIATIAAFALTIVLGIASGYWAVLPLGVGCWLGARSLLLPGRLATSGRVAIIAAFIGSVVVYVVADRDGRTSNEQPLTLRDLQGALAPTESANDRGVFPAGGYGPARPILDWAFESERFGFTDGPHFNSYINTPSYGDERAFLDAKPSSHKQAGGFRNELLDVSGRYLVRLYLGNGAVEDPNLAHAMTARNTRVRFEIPSGAANGVTIQARVAADNAIPTEIYDVVSFRDDSELFSLALVHGSARIYTNEYPNGRRLSDEIVGDGVLIGSGQLNGNVPPGFQHSVIITIELAATT